MDLLQNCGLLQWVMVDSLLSGLSQTRVSSASRGRVGISLKSYVKF